MEKFGERLRRLRGQRSQKEIAKALNMPITTLSTLENQDSVPRGEVLQKLAEFYKVPISYFYKPISTELKASDAASAWLRQLGQAAKGKDTIATQANFDLDEPTKERIAKKMRQKHAEDSANK
jgi:transcriptional regulator with XRE-family HTH domain